jgi:hypothetical protein
MIPLPYRIYNRAEKSIRVVFVTVVGSQVEVCAELHLPKKQFIEIFLKMRVSDLFEQIWIEFHPEIVGYLLASGPF